MAKSKRRAAPASGSAPKESEHRLGKASLAATVIIGVIGIYFSWTTFHSSRQGDVAATATIAVNRYSEFQDVTRHTMERRLRLAAALAKPDLVSALASWDMHFVMSDDWKPVFETTPDELRTIAKSSPEVARDVAECTAQATQLNTTVAMGRDAFNRGPPEDDPQGMSFRDTLDLVKKSLEVTQTACLKATDGLYALAYPEREPRSHMLEDSNEPLIAELAKKQIDLTMDLSAMRSPATTKPASAKQAAPSP